MDRRLDRRSFVAGTAATAAAVALPATAQEAFPSRPVTIVNAFLWLQDLATGGGLEYAYWTTIPWGIGLLAHAIAYATTRNESKGSSGG